MSKAIICVDFDGVLHSYDSGWQGAAVVSDPPVPGAMAWLALMTSDKRFDVCIYSSRSKDPAGVEAMNKWLWENLMLHFGNSTDTEAVLNALKFPTQKPAAALTIDDRAFCFMGVFPTPDWISKFRPWNKK